MCGLRTRRRTDVDPLRVELPSSRRPRGNASFIIIFDTLSFPMSAGHPRSVSCASRRRDEATPLWRRRLRCHGSMRACQRQTCSPLPSFIDDQCDDASSLLLDRPDANTAQHCSRARYTDADNVTQCVLVRRAGFSWWQAWGPAE